MTILENLVSTKMAADIRTLNNTKVDVHTTKTHRRMRVGADDIHQESYERRTIK
jgi:hypothetical protein